MKTKSRPTWFGYLENLRQRVHESSQFSLTAFDDFIKANGFAYTFFRYNVPFIYLLDYRTGAYINMSDNFAGYSSECFLREGINHTLQIYDPDHLNLFNKEIFPDRLDVLKKIRPEEHVDYVFSYTQRIRNREGVYEDFLQRNCFLSDNDRNPLFSMGMIMNINHFGNHNSIVQTVDKIDGIGVGEHEPIYKKIYYLNEEDKLFSKREKEVLLWMAEGLSSKMIADKLCVSAHTIINHRRHMHDKTNTTNAIALVSLAIKSGLI
ncbi:Regulatory protein SdiA [compost metagenome]|uniref:response regulator transcription factor n=1 Tax=Pedobacter sp. ok626 TaxID=1761882 RepID=UPI0008894DB6|nr:helix-turn-helix transcriptional regulator [Pedobacter sp. ok626]SDL13833.1 regulatory protein, luxR family [Pedobacter sp. ok626]